MDRARSMEEYLKILNEILDELDELRAAIEYDEEYMSGSADLIVPLENGIKQLLDAVQRDDYHFGHGEWDFLELARNTNPLLLPFKQLFARAEMTHKHGLEQD